MTPHPSEESFAALVDEIGGDPAGVRRLVPMLAERNALYAGRSSNAVSRMRGYVLAAFERAGLPDEALPFVLEELESGRDAYLVAAAARALRGLDRPPAGAASFLVQAIENVAYVDDAVSFDGYRTRWPPTGRTTAVEEILATILWLGDAARPELPALEALADAPRGMSPAGRETLGDVLAGLRAEGSCDCCHRDMPDLVVPEPRPPERMSTRMPSDVPMQDQDGRELTFGEVFGGRPSVVAFFYTRCDNPNKCSLTITRLAELQEALVDAGLSARITTAAITYDPDFDLPPRLRSYGLNRGVTFGESARFLRSTARFEELVDYFDLGVGFGPALVNRHRIELFLLDDEAQLVESRTRLRWSAEEVIRRIEELVRR